MDQFFYPQTLAIIGVSDKPSNLGKHIISNLMEFRFTGSYEAVGLEGGTLSGRKIYPSVLDIPHEIDLAVILVNAEAVPDVAELCGRKGIKRLVISTGGFSEYLPERKELEAKLLAICRQYGMRFIGPNCLAVINMENGLFLPFSPNLMARWQRGPVGIISQSGGIATTLSQHLSYHKIGVGKVASIGNKLNVDEVDLLQYYLTDPETKIIYMYLEGLPRGRELFELCCAADKPILIHKSNVSAASNEIAHSHTASLANDDAAVEAALQQAGVIRVRSLEETLDCIKVLCLKPMKGNRLACMGCGGGPSVIVADDAHRNGFSLPPYPKHFLEWLKSKATAGVINPTNPLDYGDLYDLDLHIEALRKFQSLPDMDAVFYDMNYNIGWEKVVTGEAFARLFEYLSRVNHDARIPVFIRPSLAEPETWELVNKRIDAPLFGSIGGCFNAMRMIQDAWQAKRILNPVNQPFVDNADAIQAILKEALKRHKTFLDYEGYDILSALHIPVVKQHIVPIGDIKDVSQTGLKYPVAVKAIGTDLFHKTEAGGVRLNLRNTRELSKALMSMAATESLSMAEGFLVQEMVTGGVEMVVGGKRDPQFGPVVMVGMGGTLVELFSDIRLAIAPIDIGMAKHMIESLKCFQLLRGHRKMPEADIDSLCVILQQISHLMALFPEISEIDLNPIKVLPLGKGSLVIDCKFFLNHSIQDPN